MSTCLWKRKEISLKTKVKVFKAAVLPVLLYGAETWNVTAQDVRMLHACYLRCLRRLIHKSSYYDHVSNAEVLRQCGLPSLQTLLMRQRLRWLGHLCRMPSSRTPRQVLFSKCLQEGPHYHPAMRWVDLIMQDLQHLDIKSALQLAADRPAWRHLSGSCHVPA